MLRLYKQDHFWGENMKKLLVLLTPLLIFAILVIPYSILNNEVIVDWLGCGCPQVDEHGNIYVPRFNANDFTACFWGGVTILTTTVSAFLSLKAIKKKIWIRIPYVILVLSLSLCISYLLCQVMMWN